jgi:hypothetical protein
MMMRRRRMKGEEEVGEFEVKKEERGRRRSRMSGGRGGGWDGVEDVDERRRQPIWADLENVDLLIGWDPLGEEKKNSFWYKHVLSVRVWTSLWWKLN